MCAREREREREKERERESCECYSIYYSSQVMQSMAVAIHLGRDIVHAGSIKNFF